MWWHKQARWGARAGHTHGQLVGRVGSSGQRRRVVLVSDGLEHGVFEQWVSKQNVELEWSKAQAQEQANVYMVNLEYQTKNILLQGKEFRGDSFVCCNIFTPQPQTQPQVYTCAGIKPKQVCVTSKIKHHDDARCSLDSVLCRLCVVFCSSGRHSLHATTLLY